MRKDSVYERVPRRAPPAAAVRADETYEQTLVDDLRKSGVQKGWLLAGR